MRKKRHLSPRSTTLSAHDQLSGTDNKTIEKEGCENKIGHI
jgi:hypothetical protein